MKINVFSQKGKFDFIADPLDFPGFEAGNKILGSQILHIDIEAQVPEDVFKSDLAGYFLENGLKYRGLRYEIRILGGNAGSILTKTFFTCNELDASLYERIKTKFSELESHYIPDGKDSIDRFIAEMNKEFCSVCGGHLGGGRLYVEGKNEEALCPKCEAELGREDGVGDDVIET